MLLGVELRVTKGFRVEGKGWRPQSQAAGKAGRNTFTSKPVGILTEGLSTETRTQGF